MGSVRHLGRFAVRAQLGNGALGPVFRAYDPRLERDVAVRQIDEELGTQARAMAQLSHPNLVQVYEVNGDDLDGMCIVMELVAGVDLARWLAAELRPPAAIADAFLQAGRGLAAAHAKGIVHGDFKPTNVLVGADGRVRVADLGLARGPATVASDARAFGAALQAALGDHVSPKLRAALGRNDFAAMLAALEPRKRSWTPWIVAGGVVIALGGGGAIGMLLLGSSPKTQTCEQGGQWYSPVERGRISYVDKTRKGAAGIATRFDKVEGMLRGRFLDVCKGARQGKLTAEQVAMRTACLQRRVFELDTMVDGVIEGKRGSIRRATFEDGGEGCDYVIAPPFTDADKVAALWARYARIDELAGLNTAKQHEQVLVALERDAVAANEKELAMRVALALARNLEAQDRLDESDKAAERASVAAQQLKALHTFAFALLQRNSTAMRAGNGEAAMTFAKSAEQIQQLIAEPTPLFQVQIAHALARSAHLLGDWKATVDYTRKGIDIAVKNPASAPELEMDMRLKLVIALVQLEDHKLEAVAEGDTLVARSKQLQGEHDPNYAIALNMSSLAKQANGDVVGAEALCKQSLNLLIEVLPPDHSAVTFQHVDYATRLIRLGRAEEARTHLVEAVAAIDKNQTVRGQRSHLRLALATADFDVGRFEEAMATIRESVENAVADQGLDHPRTVDTYATLIEMALELNLLDEAERSIAAVSQAFKSTKQDVLRIATGIRGEEAELAVRRGKPKDGERIAREALASLTELKGTDENRRPLLRGLAEALFAQRRYPEAAAEFSNLLALAKKTYAREDNIAVAELGLARVDFAEGKRAEAQDRARAAREVLEKYKSQGRALAIANQIIGDRPAKKR